MRDIHNPQLLYFKAILFLVLGLGAAAALVALHPEWLTIALLLLAIWSLARAYYFAFYVIEHYVDPRYRFAGLIDFVKYALRRGTDQADG